MKKYFMAAVAFICISLVSIVMTSCSSEETTSIKTETVYYKYDTANLYYVKGQEAKLAAFITEMGEVLSSVSSADVTESNLIQRIQAIVGHFETDEIHRRQQFQFHQDLYDDGCAGVFMIFHRFSDKEVEELK